MEVLIVIVFVVVIFLAILFPKTDGRLKPVAQFTKNGEFVRNYKSITEASSTTGISYSGISNCCRGVQKTSGGYVWIYRNTNSQNKKVINKSSKNKNSINKNIKKLQENDEEKKVVPEKEKGEKGKEQE